MSCIFNYLDISLNNGLYLFDGFYPPLISCLLITQEFLIKEPINYQVTTNKYALNDAQIIPLNQQTSLKDYRLRFVSLS